MLFYVRKHKVNDALVEEPNELWVPDSIRESKVGEYILVNDNYPAAYVVADNEKAARQWAIQNLR